LDPAFDTLSRLKTLWKKHRHEVLAVPVQPREPRRVRQPTQTKAKTRQPAQTAPATTQPVLSQPHLLLAALRTAQQPLMIEDLRQISGVDDRRLKRNIARLVAQGKIQEMPGGTFCSIR